MNFLEKINRKKFNLISLLLFSYILLNLFDGERGLISYLKNKQIKQDLFSEREVLTTQLQSIELKNNLLTNDIDLDYLEILYRQRFMQGKSKEKIFIE
tara:strand:+ start:190 stop:483 length:294 start_codon:yes stop_codon:yes gene_type:complete